MKAQLRKVIPAMLALFTLNAPAITRYVDLNSPSPTPPYTNWLTAATNIQDAIDAADPGDEVLVANGVYQIGGASFAGSNRVYVSKALIVRSVNGPAVTSIAGTTNGAGPMRCVYLANGATLSGFTLTNGGAIQVSNDGGGVKCATPNCIVTNCVITGNLASVSGGGAFSGTLINCKLTGNSAGLAGAGFGGGANGCVLINCVLSGNKAGNQGGGAFSCALTNCLISSNSITTTSLGGGTAYSTLVNCTVVGNSAYTGGGAHGGTFLNCIIYYNQSVTVGSSNYSGGSFVTFITNSCTTPLPSSGEYNIVTLPAFVDLTGGNFRLQLGSPCINAGDNSFAFATSDLDGNPRIVGDSVDIGAYESQSTNEVHYVTLSGSSPIAPFTNWLTAATNIQDAVDAAAPGDFIVVSNGTYQTGGRTMYGAMTNRVVLTNGVMLLSLNGANVTTIVGGTQTRCVYVGSNSLLSGFTITNGHARSTGHATNEQSGGGIWCEPGGAVANCLVISNFTGFGGIYVGLGGGIFGGTISNCTIARNIAGNGGGAAGFGVLWNCNLSNNVARIGGGAYGVTLQNCLLSSNLVVYTGGNTPSGGGAAQCVASNCVVTGNSAQDSGYGGGTFRGTNFNCSIARNTAAFGGGCTASTNFSSTISENVATVSGGGVMQGALYNCILTNNRAGTAQFFTGNGGGASGAILYNCRIVANTGNYGGGTYQSTNFNCVIFQNTAYTNGGGVYQGTLYFCTVASNTVASSAVSSSGGGLYGGTAYNSVIYFNAAPKGDNWSNAPAMNFCCTTPLTVPLNGNLGNDPLFVDLPGGDLRLRCGSPCVDAAFTNSSILATTNDLRGKPRPLDGDGDATAKFDMGAFEYDSATDLTVGIRRLFSFDTFAPSYPVSFVAQLGGCADVYWWDFGDGAIISNQYKVSHAWTLPGTYSVKLFAHYPAVGQTLTATMQVQVAETPIYYADINSPGPAYPHTNWATAAQTIQAAVAAGTIVGRRVVVADGLYQASGVIVYGSMYNSVALTNAVVVESVNGPGTTFIQPSSAARCAYVGSNAILSGFTLTGGRTLITGDTNREQSGGGLWCEAGAVVTNCIISSNRAQIYGGGAYQGSFYNCMFSNNAVAYINEPSLAQGGGVFGGTLYNCTIRSNSAPASANAGGGVSQSTLYDCTLMRNAARGLGGRGGAAHASVLYNCQVLTNSARDFGGGVNQSRVYGCRISGNEALYGGGSCSNEVWNSVLDGNRAYQGGGAYWYTSGGGNLSGCTLVGNVATNAGGGVYGVGLGLTNCIIYFNTANNSSSNFMVGSTQLRWCCTAPTPTGPGFGNITNDPLFVNLAGADFHLQSNSPCINSGTNAAGIPGTDFDGNLRITGGTVDIGAYEFQSPVSAIPYAWFWQYGLPIDNSADPDGDGLNNWAEWRCDSDPTNAVSALRMVTASNTASGLNVTWQSVSTRSYFLERATNFGDVPPFQAIATNIAGVSGMKTYMDPSATNGGPYFYRVGVQ